jgi:hypothetical protein
LIYIGKATSLLESASEETTLLDRWRTQWNKPAAFTWNSNQGLEMHYRIEPPANWIVSSSEDESLSSIDVDLSEFEDVAMFTEDGDLLKCESCGTLWTDLDQGGLCLICQKTEYQDEEFKQLISFESDFKLQTDQMVEFGKELDLEVDNSSFHSSLLKSSTSRGVGLIATSEDDVDFFPFDSDGNLLGPEAFTIMFETSFMPEDLG